MWSKALTYQLKPGRYAEYKKAHDELWPELAQAMTDAAENPLLPRVIVNRVWQHLFGVGLVPTVDNFGATMQALNKEPRFLYEDSDAGREQILADYQKIIDEIDAISSNAEASIVAASASIPKASADDGRA